MKKIIIGLVSIMTLSIVSCKEDEKTKNSLNPYDSAIVKAANGTKSVIFDDLTSYQDSIDAIFQSEYFVFRTTKNGISGTTGISKEEVDREKKEFTLKNRWVVDIDIENGPYVLGRLTYVTELIIERRWNNEGYVYDTIAYVPSKILLETGNKVRAAFAKEDYDECRRLLQTEYKFKPIDAAGYEKLKAAGLN